MTESKPYPRWDEEDGSCTVAAEPAAGAALAYESAVLPAGMDYAHLSHGVLQVTSDIEKEIAEVERGETVSMSDFKTMFAKWL